MSIAFIPLLDQRFQGESPVWDERREVLFFVDMGAPAVHAVRLDGTGLQTWPVPAIAGSIGLGESDRLIVAQPKRLLVLDPDSGALNELARLPDDPVGNRLNDGKVGPDGAFWVGSSMAREETEALAALYRVDGKGIVTRVLDGDIEVSNGLAWTGDGKTMFHSDSRAQWIDRYAFDSERGTLSAKRRIANPSAVIGRPDGGACDDQGRYWSAGVSAGCLNCWSEEGALLDTIKVPAPAPSMPAFCGPGLTSLVVTSLDKGDAASHADGRVLIAHATGLTGVPVTRWRDGP